MFGVGCAVVRHEAGGAVHCAQVEAVLPNLQFHVISFERKELRFMTPHFRESTQHLKGVGVESSAGLEDLEVAVLGDEAEVVVHEEHDLLLVDLGVHLRLHPLLEVRVEPSVVLPNLGTVIDRWIIFTFCRTTAETVQGDWAEW